MPTAERDGKVSVQLNEYESSLKSVQEQNWYKPEPGQPYRPFLALPDRVKDIAPWLAVCADSGFSCYDPPRALTAATAMVPDITSNIPTTHPLAPMPSPTVDPGPRDTALDKGLKAEPSITASLTQLVATEGPSADPKSRLPSPGSIGELFPSSSDSPSATSGAVPQTKYDISNEPSFEPQDMGEFPMQGQTEDGSSQADPDKSDNDVPHDPEATWSVTNRVFILDGPIVGVNTDGVPTTLSGFAALNQGHSLLLADQTILLTVPTTLPPISMNEHQAVPATGGVSVDQTFVIPDHSTLTLSGIPISMDRLNVLWIGKSFYQLPAPPSNPTAKLANEITPVVLPSKISIYGTILTAGDPPITISGTRLSLDNSHNFIIGDTTLRLPPITANPLNPSYEFQQTIINSQTIQWLSNGISIAGTTLTHGEPPITVSGTRISLGPSALVVGTNPVPFSTVSQSQILPSLGISSPTGNGNHSIETGIDPLKSGTARACSINGLGHLIMMIMIFCISISQLA